MKTCCRCKDSLPLNAYNKRKDAKDGYQNMCRECNKQKSKDYYYDNRENILEMQRGAHRAPHLLRRYGLTEQDYNNLLDEQNGVCYICEKPCTKQENLCVGHNHETGKVRGLLCDRCNVGLGRFNDDVKLLLKAVEYLERGD